jgi:hypothetical protein
MRRARELVPYALRPIELKCMVGKEASMTTYESSLRHRLPGAPLFFVAALFLVPLLSSCQLPGFLQAELPDDGPPIATSQAAARRFVEKVTAAGENAVETKRLDLTITEVELTSFLSIASELSEQLRAHNVQSLEDLERLQDSPELRDIEGLQEWTELLRGREGLPNLGLLDLSLRVQIREPQVHFQSNGHIIIRGYVEVLGQRQPLRLVLAPRASQGELVLDFVEGKLGPVSVPEELIDQVGTGLAKLIMAGDEYIEITQIRVDDGSLTISGGYRK